MHSKDMSMKVTAAEDLIREVRNIILHLQSETEDDGMHTHRLPPDLGAVT